MDYLSSVLAKLRSVEISDTDESQGAVLIDSPTNLGNISNFGFSSYYFDSVDYYAQAPTGYHILSGQFNVEDIIKHLQKQGFTTYRDSDDPTFLKKELYAGGGPMVTVDEERLLCTMGWDRSKEKLRNLSRVFEDEEKTGPASFGAISTGIEAVLPAKIVSFKRGELDGQYWDIASGYSFDGGSIELKWFITGSEAAGVIADEMETTIEKHRTGILPPGYVADVSIHGYPI